MPLKVEASSKIKVKRVYVDTMVWSEFKYIYPAKCGSILVLFSYWLFNAFYLKPAGALGAHLGARVAAGKGRERLNERNRKSRGRAKTGLARQMREGAYLNPAHNSCVKQGLTHSVIFKLTWMFYDLSY